MLEHRINNLPTLFQAGMRAIYNIGGFDGPCSLLAKAIWDNTGIETILTHLAKCPDVNSLYTTNKFTPMILASIQGNLPAMEALKEKGADLDAQDILGYSALHHAAMMGNEIGVQKLLDWQASPQSRTTLGATYMDFLRFNAPFRNGTIPLNPELFSAHTQDLAKFDPSCIPADAVTIDEMVATPEMLMAIYAREIYLPDTGASSTRETFLAPYYAFKKHPTKLSVKSVGDTCGLFAEQSIKKGEIVAEYVGQLTSYGWDPLYKTDAYIWSDYPSIDAGPFRSAASMANEGFPNTAVTSLRRFETKPGLDGLPNRKLLYALNDIEPGDEIRIDYGSQQDLKWDQNYQNFGFEELKEYLKSHSWSRLAEDFQVFDQFSIIDALGILHKVRYILETPTVLPRLAKEGAIKRKDLLKIRKLNAWYNQRNPDGKAHRDKVLQLAVKAIRRKNKNEL